MKVKRPVLTQFFCTESWEQIKGLVAVTVAGGMVLMGGEMTRSGVRDGTETKRGTMTGDGEMKDTEIDMKIAETERALRWIGAESDTTVTGLKMVITQMVITRTRTKTSSWSRRRRARPLCSGGFLSTS